MPAPETIPASANPLDKLTKAERAVYFFVHKDAASVDLLHKICAEVESIKDAAKKREFFLNHPELEARYSAANFR